MDIVLTYIKAFAVGGLFCVIGQVLIDRTKLTPARILTCYVVAGVILGALGLYQPLADWAGAGATVPLTGFGNALAQGVKGRGRKGLSRRVHRRLSPRRPPVSAPQCFRVSGGRYIQTRDKVNNS